MEAYAIAIAKQSLFLVLLMSAPPVLTAMVVGVMVSLIQATTQIQEQTLTFVPKLVAIACVIALLGPIGMAELVAFTKSLFESFSMYVQ
ncbi:MAG: hypothetical protein ACD_73C00315G0003 [uncultured bacterium]|nr:MAG: hypothetical protein ACD_73C00315G0003 [uncultured bacterium]